MSLRLAVICGCLLLAAVGRARAIERSETVMGSLARVVECSGRGDGGQAVEAAFGRMREIDNELTLYNEGSELWKLNDRGRRGWVVVGADLYRVLERAREISEATRGSFDVTVLPLMLRLGGYRGLAVPFPPDARLMVSFYGLSLDPARRAARLMGTGMGVDLGAIGKGYGVDAAYSLMRSRGSDCGLVEIGGTVRVWGERRGRWRIGVRDPMRPSTLAGTLVMDRGAVASSGNYFGGAGSGLARHILDPRTRKPVDRQRGVTVLAADATTADALSTALFVLGRDDARPILDSQFPGVTAIFFNQLAGRVDVSVIGPAAGAWRAVGWQKRLGSREGYSHRVP